MSNTDTDLFLTAPKVRARYSISDMALWRWVKEEKFPSPSMVVGRRRYWKLSDLETWERTRAEAA